MIRTPRDPRVPGRLLLQIARIVFDEPVLTTVVTPTIADMQREYRDAGGDRRLRLRARWRGYAAFWRLVGSAPFVFHRWPLRAPGVVGSEDRAPGIAFGLTAGASLLLGWRLVGAWTIAALAGAVLFALIIHRWQTRHPSEIADPTPDPWRIPEINMSRVPVRGDLGGLVYVVGSVAVGLIGLPFLRWFLAVSMTLALLCAALLAMWHERHAHRLNSLSLR